tara:strand:- start:32 stop:742 length:711 start_codon:yes stop_codon:yes gene_type:complete
MTQLEYDTLLEQVIQTHFLKLDIDVDINNLLNEYKSVEKKYSFEKYRTKYWGVKKKYARSWSGIALVSSDGNLYSDMREGQPLRAAQTTPLKDECPHFYRLIKKLNGEFAGCRARIMRISPHESLVWHSHVHEHNQHKSLLTVQIPIIVPKQFEYCVVDKDEFKWYKRVYRPNWFKTVSRKRLEAGSAYVFNSYHYHNVYNYSDEHRVALMLYLDLKKPRIFELVKRSMEKQNEKI